MQTFSEFIAEENLPDEVLSGFSYELSSKSSARRDVLIVRSSDRDNDADEIVRRLRQAGITAERISSSASSVDPISGDHEGKKFMILMKPLKGGMGETTLNSSITELFPAIAFEKNYNPTSVEDFMEYLHDVDIDSLKCVHAKDNKAAKETINKADSSSKYNEKMKNAIAIHQYLKDTNKDKTISSVHWGYRSSSKPPGVPGNHPGDIFIVFSDKMILGVSLKAGGKKTSEPQLNTYLNPVYNFFGEQRTLESLYKTAHTQVYSKIEGIPSANTFRSRELRTTQKILKDFNTKNNRQYEQYYDDFLEIMRKGIITLFNKDKKKTLDYIKSEVLRDAPDVPTIVIKASGEDYEEVTDKDQLGVFLPQVEFVRAYTETKSKQNWNIELKSGSDKLIMKMTIRTNKSGHAGVKKLGQFNLSVKYNGLKKS